ncbi:hypothetical protein FisN_13Lh150 [Fistulifera solaris]|uniref:DNA-directed primase/polymerase protein n=1 Tax=Fistulifera solaris TaxID=1519565 RepID=A0A1Z5JF91_FISSO|nr:hypothetical protein FisN_13Lh150 [Fistulifera solaris]|eukprot:GAX12675.1 hypothetical protein FisN_13Lh150 [Fistulifera solaris]
MSSPTRHSSPSKKVSVNQKDDDLFLWREDGTSEPIPRIRSKGIPPKSFHGNRRQRPGDESVRSLHNSVQQSLLKEEKRKVVQHNEIKRSAFKQLTSLRTWPLQSRAFQHWRELMDEYMHDGGKWRAGVNDGNPDSQESDTSDKSGGSLSTASSGISVQDPKRVLRDTKQSPAKSKLKNQYRSEFESERNLCAPLLLNHDFGSPLWSMEPRIFSSEKSDTGKRKYMVGHLGRFMDYYWCKVDPQHRFYYELIPENTPCRLYLDLEFSKTANPGISNDNAEVLLDELFMEVKFELEDQLGIQNFERTHVVDLESSTDTKFSRHWIVHLPDQQLFAHTAAVGHFMQQFISRLANDQATNMLKERGRHLLQKYFLVDAAPSKTQKQEAEPKKTCFIDAGVYTKNRLFRILGSQKFGKPPSAALRIADRNEFCFPNGFSNKLFYLPDMQRKSDEQRNETIDESQDNLDEIENAVEEFKTSTDWKSHAEALAQTLVVPLNWAKVAYPVLPFDRNVLRDIGRGETKISGQNRGMPSSMSLSVGKSPYPLIDTFVENHLGARGGIQGYIRTWSVAEAPSRSNGNGTSAPAFITYQMSRNRWCECIGRAHRSNNIQWTVDLRLWHCIQSCHDPDCRMLGFRGTPVPLPQDIRDQVEDQIFEEQLARVDEDTLIDQARSMTKELTPSQSLQTALSSLTINGEAEEKANDHNFLPYYEKSGEDSFEQQLLNLDTAGGDLVSKAEETSLLACDGLSEEESFEAQLLRLEETVTSTLKKASLKPEDVAVLHPQEAEVSNEKINTIVTSKSKTVEEHKPLNEPYSESSDDDNDFDLLAFVKEK